MTTGNNNKSRAAKGRSKTGQGPDVASDRARQLKGNSIAANRKQEKSYATADKKSFSPSGTSKAKAISGGTHRVFKTK